MFTRIIEERDVDRMDQVLQLVNNAIGVSLNTLRNKHIFNSEAQLERITQSLLHAEAAKLQDARLRPTLKTAMIIEKGGAAHILEQEREEERRDREQALDIRLSIEEHRRNRWLSIIAIIISALALVISIFTFFYK